MKITAFLLLLFIGTFLMPAKNNTVQFNISPILNARPVTVLVNNKPIIWTKGIDGRGLADGYSTLSAALFNGDKEPHALPDDPLFAANASHPEIRLHYSNRDSVHNQACAITGAGEVEFAVAPAKYKAIYLALTSAEGASALKIELTYTDGVETKDFTLPDYYMDIAPNDPNLCYLAHDLAKWGNHNNMTEKDHHNIDLLNMHPDGLRRLKGVKIVKGEKGYLVFWAAAGEKVHS